MARGFSRDLRERVLHAWTSGLSAAEIERTIGVSRSNLQRWKRKQAVGQSLEPGHAPGRRRLIAPEAEAQLRAQVAAHPDATLAEHCARWAATEAGSVVSPATMCRSLRRLGLPLKKRPSLPVNKMRRPAPPGEPPRRQSPPRL
jgi:transposase